MRKAIAAAALLAAGATLALASGREEHEKRGEHGEREGRHRRREREPRAQAADAQGRALYHKECGACHLAFPPGFLPAESHRRILAGLERHFGENAELDPEVRTHLERWLVGDAAGAGRGSQAGTGSGEEPPMRITETPYFRRKHRGIGARAVARPSVRSLANCGACHPGAGDWDFDDDRAKIPAG